MSVCHDYILLHKKKKELTTSTALLHIAYHTSENSLGDVSLERVTKGVVITIRQEEKGVGVIEEVSLENMIIRLQVELTIY